MKDSAYKISLDIHEHASQAVLKAKKTDTGRKLHITLRAGGTPYTIEDDCYAAFKAKKHDDTILFNACTIENNEIIYEFTEQTCTAVGRCRCEIALYGPDDKLITSPSFVLLVDGTIYPDELVESTDEFSALTKLITDANGLVDEVKEKLENGEFNGADGFSPTAKVEETTDGAKITITDKNGTTTATVKNGKDGTGGTVEGAVLYTPQTLTANQQAQVRENIGALDYYSTTREELAVTLGKEDAVPNDVTSERIWGLYDALMKEHPDNVQKHEIHNNDGTFTNYEYIVSTGDYNEVVGAFNAKDDDIKKPKYLVASGVHGFEKPSIVSTYRLFRDIVTGHNVPAHFREGCVIHFLPVANPYGLDNNIRFNANGVDINRNFDWNHGINVSTGKNPGPSASSEQETQAITKWLQENDDAELFLDCHNIQGDNEIVTFIGLTDSEECGNWKKIAMRGVDRVIPFWKCAIGYSHNTVFRNSASNSEGGKATFYASEVLNIPSLGVELSVFPTGNETSRDEMAPETIAVATEVIGNVLIEFYEQTLCEVVDMTETNFKIDALTDAVNKSISFRVETGVYTVAEDIRGTTNVKIPCTSGAKMLNFFPDENTLNALYSYCNKTDGLLASRDR